MLYDLNLTWTPSSTADDIDRLLAFSASLGYDVVALNHHVSSPLPAQPRNPIPIIDSSTSSSSSPPPPTTTTTTTTTTSRLPKVLRRATILLSDPSTNFRLSSLSPLYDLLAVRPTTATAFQAACVSLPDVSLISLDLSSHLGFPIRPRPAMAAIARGVRFEIPYAQLVGSATTDPRARSNFICNAGNLVRATRGRGIVVSSGAAGPLGLRAPADVVNLLAVWGLSQERGRESLGVVPRAVVVNEAIKRTGFRGVVDIVQTAEGEGGQEGEVREGARDAVVGRGKQKRKNVDEGGGGGGGKDEAGSGGRGGRGENADTSKRQAKKLKLAARIEAADESKVQNKAQNTQHT